MGEEYLIKNTTREQREKFVYDSLGCQAGCDACGISTAYDMYQDYIDGKKELKEITMEFSRGYVKEDISPEGTNCNGGEM